MIRDLIVRQDLVAQISSWRELAEAAVQALRAKDSRAEKLRAKNWSLADAETLLNLVQQAERELHALPAPPPPEDEDDSDGAFIEAKPALSALQTLMEEANMEAGFVVESVGQGQVGGVAGMTRRELKPSVKPPLGQKLFYSPFDEPGALYLTEGAKAIAYRYLHGRHDFRKTPPSILLAKKVKMILVGDWATGVGRARDVGAQIRKELDKDTTLSRHVVHLGDIYFAGWPKESDSRFLAHWPVRAGEAGVQSWCINGNHDMYCGGDGYFDTVLGDERFKAQNGCSYFCLENDDWQILALDTAYEEWSLSNGQAAWALEKREAAPRAKGILLSHHQPHSTFESQGETKTGRVAAEAAELLQNGRLAAWIWGHEHRCAIYRDIAFDLRNGKKGALPFGACLGHGGVPSRPTRRKPEHNVHYVLTDTKNYGLEKFGVMGFGILDIDGRAARLRCINESGAEHFSIELP